MTFSIVYGVYCKRKFAYNFKTGRLWWYRKNNGVRYIKLGWLECAKASKNKSYPMVAFSKSTHKIVAHRLAWLLYYGSLPPKGIEIDHIDGSKNNYRIENLRAVPKYENMRNRAIPRNSITGILGVTSYRLKDGKLRYMAYIFVNGKRNHLGVFKTKKQAVRARRIAEIEHNYHINHGTR